MMNLVFLPATEPGDETYGMVPEYVQAYPDASVYQVRFPTMVWYNGKTCRDAVLQIRSYAVSSIVLVGFSKSGLGVWNVARMIPDLISGMILFDAPVTRMEPPRETEAYYGSNSSWQRDQPIQTTKEFETVMPKTSKLVLISGESFHTEMIRLAEALATTSIAYTFLPRPDLKHHWQSGWVEEGLKALFDPEPIRR